MESTKSTQTKVFGGYSVFHQYLGLSSFENTAASQMMHRFPLYQPTARELAFGNRMIEKRMTTTCTGIGIGLVTGVVLSLTALKNRGRLAKSVAIILPTCVGYGGAFAWGFVHAIDEWVTFDNMHQRFDSWGDRLVPVEDPREKVGCESNGLSFMAEQFRIQKIQYAPEVAPVIQPLLLNPQGLQMVYEIKFEGVESRDAIKRLKRYPSMTIEQRESVAHSMSVLAGKESDDK
jgi:hypothetical protein